MARDPRSMEQVFLVAMQAHLIAGGHGTRLITQGPEPHAQTLLIQLPPPDEGARPLTLRLSFPKKFRDEEGSAFLLQMSTQLQSDIASDRIAPLQRLLASLNPRLPIGTLGLIEDRRLLVFKGSVVIDAQAPAGAQVRQAELQLGLLLHTLNTFRGPISEVAGGAS